MTTPLRLLPVLLGTVLAIAALLLPVLPAAPVAAAAPTAPADAPADPAAAPYRAVVGMTGVRWTDVDAETTPTLQCLADRSDLAALAVRSDTPLTTTEQGWESLRTGARGTAEGVAPTAPGLTGDALGTGLAGVGVEIETLDLGAAATGEPGPAPADLALAEDRLTLVDLGVVAPFDTAPEAERQDQLAALDARLAELVAQNGGCAGFPSALVASLADVAGPDAPEGARAGLHVLLDTSRSAADPEAEGLPGFLRSPSTRQTSLVQIVDLAPTILAAHGADVPTELPGRAVLRLPDDGSVVGTQLVPMSDEPQQRAVDQTQASAAIDPASVPILAVWGILVLAALAVAAWPRRPERSPDRAPRRALDRARRVASGFLVVATTMPVMGLLAQALPWWRFEGREALTLGTIIAVLMAACARLLFLPALRRSRDLPVGAAAALVAAVLLGEALAGSPLQTSAILGSQPTVSGRFYGISNHHFGLLLAGSVVAVVVACRRLSRPRHRVLLAGAVGALVTVVCVAPSFGADFGSMLATVPTFGILVLLLSGRRIRIVHLVALGAAAAVAVLGVSVLDWLRPPAQRSHLGDFVDTLVSGGLWETVARKAGQNLGFFQAFPALWLVLPLLAALTVGVLAPERLRLRPLAALYAENPSVRAGLTALAVGVWIGFVVNDTGIALLGAAGGFLVLWVLPMCPRGAELDAPGVSPGPGPDRSGSAAS